jgi:HAD superfamily hydrolase (TIGR01490 family)
VKLALFDLDHTLLPIDSDHAWGEYTVQIGWRDAASFRRRNDAFYEDYKVGKLDPVNYLMFATEAIREQGETKALAAHMAYMRDVIEPNIRPEALELIDHHRRAGDELVMITATNEFVTQAIARRLGFEHLIALQLETGSDGWYTGRWRGTPSYREGKVERLMQWLAARGKTWADVQHSVFYSDSMNDLPLLEQVHEAVAANPDPRLRALAAERGWRILDLFAKETV